MPSSTGDPCTHEPVARSLASRTPSTTVPTPGGIRSARFSTRPMPATDWLAAISSGGVAIVVADDVLASIALGGAPTLSGSVSAPVAFDTHGLALVVTGLNIGFPASELLAAV